MRLPVLSSIHAVSVFLLTLGLLFFSCEKEEVSDNPSAELVFSADTVLFDTIFTSFGSATRHFKIFNPYDQSLNISSIRLSGGHGSPYRINVDGVPGRLFNDVLIRGGDSLYVFVETTINPFDEASPMVVEDSIIFSTNGNLQNVKLVAWGQDVNILNSVVLKTETLTAGKPYLIYNSLRVDSGHVLTIDPGVRLHFHRDTRLLVAGSILATGNYEQPVIFDGARTESSYRNIPGQWEGIWLMPGSTGNIFVNVRVRNAVNGIVAETSGSPDNPTLYLANSRIENMTYAGILASDAVINSNNTVISNCGSHILALTNGGDYSFYHCTFANYWNFSVRRTPSVIIGHSSGPLHESLSVVIGNSIIHGSLQQEIDVSGKIESGANIIFHHSLLSFQNKSLPAIFQNCIFDTVPGFVDLAKYNYRLGENSPAIDKGDPEIGNLFPTDYDGNSRIFGQAPDMGAFERYDE